jgi:exopolyphosphatase/guanosine-5'-triphosphate,3'-diphosphate pyrophosphatase
VSEPDTGAPAPAAGPAVAAIDLGSNSVRLLVLGADGEEQVRRATITRLGAGIARTGVLSPDGIDRTLDCLRSYRAELDRHRVDRVVVVGTAATRRADDREAFFDAVADVIGIRPRVIDGDEEARLSYEGATASIDAPGPYLVVDIGGGSTELATADLAGRVRSVSLPVGCVTLTETELHSDPPRPEELTNAIAVVTDLLDEALRAEPRLGEVTTVVGVAGTITTVAAVEIGLTAYDRAAVDGFVLERAAAEDVFRTLATESLDDRVHNPGLQPERADVIVAGCCILVALLRRLRADALVVRDADLLDALATGLRAG